LGQSISERASQSIVNPSASILTMTHDPDVKEIICPFRPHGEYSRAQVVDLISEQSRVVATAHR
jgi:hypothetical protein